MLSSHHEWFTGLFYLTQDNNLLNDCKLCKSHLPDFLSVCFRIDLRCHSLAPTHVSVFVVPYTPVSTLSSSGRHLLSSRVSAKN